MLILNTTLIRIVALWFVAFVAVPASAGPWLIYNNARYGTIADIPAHGFTARPPSQNGDGRSWISDDGRGQILVFGDLIVTADTPMAYRQEILGYARDDGLEIVYSAAKKNWFVYSGLLGGDIVYEKVVVTTGCDPMIGNHVYLRYPASQKAAYDAVIRHVAASLKGNQDAAMCNCREKTPTREGEEWFRQSRLKPREYRMTGCALMAISRSSPAVCWGPIRCKARWCILPLWTSPMATMSARRRS